MLPARSRAGKRKPDPEFYEYALNLLKVKPSEVVFLDDIGPNLKAAQRLGITTIRKCPSLCPPDAALLLMKPTFTDRTLRLSLFRMPLMRRATLV